MSVTGIWFIYLLVMIGLSALAFGIPEKKAEAGFLKFLKATAEFFWVMIGITFVIFTLVLVLQVIAPNIINAPLGGSGDTEENCVPDPFGGC